MEVLETGPIMAYVIATHDTLSEFEGKLESGDPAAAAAARREFEGTPACVETRRFFPARRRFALA